MHETCKTHLRLSKNVSVSASAEAHTNCISSFSLSPRVAISDKKNQWAFCLIYFAVGTVSGATMGIGTIVLACFGGWNRGAIRAKRGIAGSRVRLGYEHNHIRFIDA